MLRFPRLEARVVGDPIHDILRTFYATPGDGSYAVKPRYDYENKWSVNIDIDGVWSVIQGPYAAIPADDINNVAPGVTGYIEKNLSRTSLPGVGVAQFDCLVSDLTFKRTSDGVTLAILRAIYSMVCNRRVGNPSVWNFDDGTWQGWDRSDTTYVLLRNDIYHSSPWSVRCEQYSADGGVYIYRNFDLYAETLASCVLMYWARRNATNARIRCEIIDNVTGAQLFLSNDTPTLNTWTQFSKDILSAVQGKDVQIRLRNSNSSAGWSQVHYDDIELYCVYA